MLPHPPGRGNAWQSRGCLPHLQLSHLWCGPHMMHQSLVENIMICKAIWEPHSVCKRTQGFLACGKSFGEHSKGLWTNMQWESITCNQTQGGDWRAVSCTCNLLLPLVDRLMATSTLQTLIGMHLSEFLNILVELFVRILKYICLNCETQPSSFHLDE